MTVPARTRAGQTAIVFAIALLALIGFVALSIDGGRAFGDSRAVQNAADGAALAGAEDVARSTHDPSYKPNKARMDAMVYLARNLGIMNLLGSVTCKGVALTPSYTTIPAGYSTNIDNPTCGDGPSGGVQIGQYAISIYQPPASGNHVNDPYSIEVDLTHKLPTSFASIIGFATLPITQRAVAGSTSGRWTFMVLQHFTIAPSDITLNAATLDVVNGDIGDNSGVTTNGTSTIRWWYCAPRTYGGGDPATDPACISTTDEYLYKWNAASASFNQNPVNTVQNLVVYMQDPNFAPPSVPAGYTPDCIFQAGVQALYYNSATGVLSVPAVPVGGAFHIPPGAYQEIVVPLGFIGVVVLDATPTAAASCPAGSNMNSDKNQPYVFLLGNAAGLNQPAIDMSNGGTLLGNGVFLLLQAPGKTPASNQINLKSGAGFYINGRSDIFGYSVTPNCITAASPPSSQTVGCQLAKSSPWGTSGSSLGAALGDPISIYVNYMQGATPSSPSGGSNVIAFNSGSTSDVQGMIYAPDDNATIAGGVNGSGVGKVVVYTVTYSSNNGRIIEEYASSAPIVYGLFN